jgi:chemotaxis protein MotB
MTQRWQRKREQVSHSDDWLMTYADMITLLLCFFAVFLSLSMPKKEIPKKVDVPPQITVPVTPPDFMEGNLPFHGLKEATEPSVMEGNLPFHDPMTAEADDDAAPVTPTKANDSPAIVPAPSLVSLPQIVDQVKLQGDANIEQKGDRITTLDMNSAAFFDSGSATLSASGKSILQGVAANLKSDAYKDYMITVEGHTDDMPISTAQFPSNWELSTARASAVVHYFLGQDIPAKKLRAAGYADTFPKAPNRDANNNPISQNQAQNRRVVIKLEKIEKQG